MNYNTGLNSSNIETFVKKYSPMIYKIALEISPTKLAAEEILYYVFEKFHNQYFPLKNQQNICTNLIKILAREADLRYDQQHIFNLRHFVSTPFLHDLLCGPTNLAIYCAKKQLSKSEAAKTIKGEFNMIRNNSHAITTNHSLKLEDDHNR